jgi:sugar transferase (PEP-CTERM/EpsH1 system associated)
MNILYICHKVPYPPNRGGKIRSFNMIRHLSQKHSVVVASLAHSERELQESAGLSDYCESVIVDVVPDKVRWMQAVKALPTAMPSSAAYFSSKRLHRRIQEKTRQMKFDVVFVHCAFVAEYALNVDARLKILDYGDLDSAKWAEYSTSKPFPLSAGYWLEAKKLRRYERNLISHFDRCTVTTEGEREEFMTLGVPKSCTVIPNGVDTTYFSKKEKADFDGSAVVFLGRMDYFPNIDGVCYFVERVLPLIRQSMPDVEFRIIGSNPSKRVLALSQHPGVVVTGHVPDVRCYLQDAALSVAPLRIARGTQNKILESMAMGIPVVATPCAAKGICAVPGRDLLVAEDPALFARHTLDLLQNPQLRGNLSEAGQRQVKASHLWPGSMQILDDLISEVDSGSKQELDMESLAKQGA